MTDFYYCAEHDNVLREGETPCCPTVVYIGWVDTPDED